ncbi:MAG: sterol desaturase family protein [Candidatus Eremiobacteraeota bacterium]|nr:sterol desaturase family protein [Candidatus Eremiobacteraeota bacterium]
MTFVSFWRHGSNTVLLLGALALVVLFATHVLAFAPASVLALVIGALVFFISEYTTHRFLLHAAPQKNAFVLRLQHRLHYDHHVDPARLDLLFLPLWFALPVAALTLAIYFAVTRDWSTSGALLLGSVLGLVWYEWVHYVAHIPYVPKTPFGRWMKKYHLWHHFKNERLWFGVTNPSMDVAWRTYARVDDVERSGTTRVLFPK